MPVILKTLLSVLGSTLLSMIAALLTERVLKALIIKGLEVLVDKTENQADNDLLKILKEAWEQKKPEEK